MTLDVRSNQPNNPTIVLDFYNESDVIPSSTNPNFEMLTSTSWEFVCWSQVSPASVNDPFFRSPLNVNLTQAQEGFARGSWLRDR